MYTEEREQMVRFQLVARGIKNKRVIDAFRKVPRHLFVNERFRDDAYGDHPLPIGAGQTISQPFIVARMTEFLEVTEDTKVLEIGTGSGYQTAILAELAKEVYTVERIESLLEGAKKILDNLGYKNIRFKTGDGTLGWRKFAPFDRIIVTAAAPDITQTLFEQLKENGKMVMPLGERFSQVLTVVEKARGKKKVYKSDGCIFVPLIGEYGFEQ